MTPDNSQHFAKLMACTGEVYSKSISKQLCEIYWRSLQEYSIEQIQQAIQHHINNPDVGQFMPKPADIVRCIDGKPSDQALRAWSKVEYAIKRVGHNDSVIFDDTIIHSVIRDIGGWIELCKLSIHDLQIKAKQFQQHYLSYLQGNSSVHPEKLVGEIERGCWNGQRKQVEPIYIGDTKKVHISNALGISEQRIEPITTSH